MDEVKELKPLSKKHKRVMDEYLICWNQTKAYMKVHPKVTYESAKTASARLFANDNFSSHLKLRLDEAHMSADEALKLQADIARGDIGQFFKIIDEWMFNPLPSYEILEEMEVMDETVEPPKKRVSYRVRHVALDMDKVLDPKYSHLIRKFSDSQRSGLGIELYSRQDAIRDVLKVQGKIKDGINVNMSWKDFISGNTEPDSE